ncbi:hypothetical protein QEV83_02235 [Methylocapsa sp. D3K7]|nr:hypothetical protein [Methylocapsa sp. D3K7]WGJ15147.1 hypothetical protein QEV83_02235 [Methylocapsa sp. D3K7]
MKTMSAIEKHRRGVVTVVKVEEYVRPTGKPAADRRTAQNDKMS